MNQQDKVKNNIFGAVLTDVAPSSNYRGETEASRSVLQKLRFPDGEHTVISAEAIRNRLREMLREDGLGCNRSRLKNERELTVKYEEYPNPTKWADDKLFGFLAVNKRKEIEDTETGLKKAKEEFKKAKDDDEKARLLQVKIGELETKLAKLREYPAFQGDSILRVNYAVSLDPFNHNSTMHQSPMITGAFSNADNSAIIQREVHVTAYQYPFGLNLNDLSLGTADGDNPERAKLYRKWTAILLRAIGELNGVAGNHARTMYSFAPVSIVLRLTARRTPDFDLYGYRDRPQESQRELLEGLKSGRLPSDEFYLGGRIVRENPELNNLLNSNAGNQGKQAVLDTQTRSEEKNRIVKVKVFDSPVEAIEALITNAGLKEQEEKR